MELSFPDFVKKIFPSSYTKFVKANHILNWANRLENNQKTATLSARKHLKSTIIYAYLMWRIFKMEDDESWYYISYTDKLARYHIKNIKKLIKRSPFFEGIKDLTLAESNIKYSWGEHTFEVTPSGINNFNRGWHGYGVICDDILADPTNELNYGVIQAVTDAFFEEVMSLPIEDGELHLVGTAQHQEDLFFQIQKKAPGFDWASYPAITNETEGITLWPDMFPIERLRQIRDEEIGERAFNKEYMCSPVWSEDAFFKREELIPLIDPGLKNIDQFKDPDAYVIAGLDIGKVRHPSHFTAFLHSKGLIIQIYQIFMDNWDYTKQVDHINALIEGLNIRRLYYDDTRGELESFAEQRVINKSIWMGVKFTQNEKFKMAGNFMLALKKGNLRLQNNDRMIRSILSVNSGLDAIETVDGHGDAFWSIALALSHKNMNSPTIVGSGRFR